MAHSVISICRTVTSRNFIDVDLKKMPYGRQRISWWRHEMETFSASLAICAGNSPVPVNSRHKGQWRGALMFSLIRARIDGWVNNGEAGDLRSHCTHYDVMVMSICPSRQWTPLRDSRYCLRTSIVGCAVWIRIIIRQTITSANFQIGPRAGYTMRRDKH